MSSAASARRTRYQRRQTKSIFPTKETLRLLEEGRTFEEIAKSARELSAPSSPSSPISSNEAKPSSSPAGWPRTLQPDRRRLPPTRHGPPQAPQRSPPHEIPTRKSAWL